MVGVLVCCIAVSLIFFFRSLFRSCAVFSFVCFLCICSSLISFSRFDISVSDMLFFLLFLLYVFCCFCSATFGTSKSFSFSSLSRSFLSVIVVIKFDISDLVLESGKQHSFSDSINFS